MRLAHPILAIRTLKKLLTSSLLFALLPLTSQAQTPQTPASSPDAIATLQKISQTLTSLSSLSYHYTRELSYTSENYHQTLEADITLEFDPAQQPIGTIYQARNADQFEIFNGSEILRGNNSAHTIQMSAVRSSKDLDRVSFLYNSPATLRLVLPGLIADPTIVKSIAAQTESTIQVNLVIPHAVLNATGTISPITLPRDTTYRITVNRKTFLPLEVRQTNSQNSDFMLVTFANLSIPPAKLVPSSWLYTSYQDYRLVTPGPAKKLLAVDTVAPTWTLPIANNNGQFISLADTLKDPKTKLILLEFWISHCGFSIDAVSKLNTLIIRFAPAGLKVLAVNPDDNDSTIQTFVKNFAPRYTLISGGQKAADDYGISGFPIIYLINSQGKIVYAGAFDQQALNDAISAHLH
jgi:AhpC/TSA family